MTVQNSANYTLPSSPAFQWADADGDGFDRQHVSDLAIAVENHNHISGRGAPVIKLNTATVPAAVGQVRVNGEDMQWYGMALQTALRDGIFTTAGDLLYRNAGNTTTRLPVGTLGDTLKITAASTVAWSPGEQWDYAGVVTAANTQRVFN